MAKNIQAIRGMHDILPEQSPRWQQLEQTVKSILSGYGYSEIRMPILEKTDLFCRSIGEVIDIEEKETYSLETRTGKSMNIDQERPECSRLACRDK